MAKKPSKKSGPKTNKPKTNKKEMLGYYRDMLLIRRFEEKAGQLYGMGHICLLYTSPSPRDGLLSRMPSSA